ncbi:MAG: sulfatase [Thermoanaerobaculia bacterium]
MHRSALLLLPLLAVFASATACSRAPGPPAPGTTPDAASGSAQPAAAAKLPQQSGFDPAPTRGYILISIDALRADHLGVYGYAKPTSPFLDELARRAAVFDHAFAQIPSTLPSHMSMFTGLYPAEHGVFPPSSVLAPEIRTLPEIFLHAGFRTSGHSEGGYVQGGYGFARGFSDWTDTPYADDTDVERTFGKGVAFLRSLSPTDRFFLFLHTYTVHDPYAPPERYRKMFWPGPPPPGAGEASGAHFAAINDGKAQASPEAVAYFEALYDASIRYADDQLRQLFSDIEGAGLARDTTIILTSDHGEEFREHGRLVHTQIYPECLHIPLLIVHPGLTHGVRIGRLVQTIDYAPTLYDLAGIPPPPKLSGVSLKPLLGSPDRALSGEAYAELKMMRFNGQALLAERDGALMQANFAAAVMESDGHWVSKETSFDALPPALDFRAVAFHEPREVEASVDGQPEKKFMLGTDWTGFHLDLPGSARKHRVRLTTAGCASPLELGEGADGRCLSFKLYGPPLERRELFDLSTDPLAAHDLSSDRTDLLRDLLNRLKTGYDHRPRAAAADQALSEEQIKNLRALGYLQ